MKKFKVLFFTLIFMFSFSVLAFADNLSSDFNVSSVKLPPITEYKYSIVAMLPADSFWSPPRYYHYVLSSNTPFYNNNGSLTNDGIIFGSCVQNDFTYPTLQQYTSNISMYTIKSSNKDILNSDNTVFFSPPRQVVDKITGIHLEKALFQIVGLIPLLLGLVISFLGLRKGLAFLSQILHQA